MKVQNIIWPKAICESDLFAYVRVSGGQLLACDRDTISIPKNASISTDTYHNFFSLRKMLEFTNYRNWSINLSGQGKCHFELIGIKLDDYYRHEHVLISKDLELDIDKKIEINADFYKYELLYIYIVAQSDLVLGKCSFDADLESKNPIKIAYCICTFNREPFVKKFVNTIAEQTKKLNIEYFISNNGPEYHFRIPENCHVYPNRNLGGSGGFTRAVVEANKKSPDISHFILADDDIEISLESVLRTYQILLGLKPEFQDYFISGSMLSLDEPWLQYERVATLDRTGFKHFGASQDVRSKDIAIENSTSRPMKALAGWWYCVIPKTVFKEFGLPLPVFVRGDDVEFSYRCQRYVLSFNGICVWHVPFIKKYNEVMEDYYLTRNMLMLSLRYSQTLSGIRPAFFDKKFRHNLYTYDYAAAELNLMAAEEVLNKEYFADPADNHTRVAKVAKGLIGRIDSWRDQPNVFPKSKRQKVFKRNLKMILQLFGLYRHKVGYSCGGFVKDINSYVGKNEVVVYQGDGVYRRYKFDKTKAISLFLRYRKICKALKLENSRLSEDLRKFSAEKSTLNAWEKLFQPQQINK